MDLLDNQPEFTKSVWDYLDILVTNERIEKGRALLAKYRADLRRAPSASTASTATSSPRSGASKATTACEGGNRPVLRSTATLACIGRRQNYFRERIPRRRWKSSSTATSRPDRLVGSWAGAFGPTQFMPTAFIRYAVDFDRDGRRDVVELGARPHRLDRQ